MITLALVVLAVTSLYAVEHGWPGFRRIGAWWLRHGDPVREHVRRAPLTYVYLVMLTFTTWLLSNSDPRLRAAFLAEQSTTLHQLSTHPVTVLLRSSMYVTPFELPVWWIAFSLVVAPLERRYGWLRVLAGFAVGHVGATVAVALLQLWVGPDPSLPGLAPTRIDVGASYGFFALAALASYQRHGRRRLLWIGALAAWLGGSLALEVEWAGIGHVVAALLGFASFRLITQEAAVRHEARVRARHLYDLEH